MPEYARVCQSMPEYVRVCQSMPEYARVCQSMPEYARVCQSMPESCPSHPQVIPKLSPVSAQDVPKSSLLMPSRTHEASMKPAHRVQCTMRLPMSIDISEVLKCKHSFHAHF